MTNRSTHSTPRSTKGRSNGASSRRTPGGAPAAADRLPSLAKCPTGIAGLDEVTGGGLPRGRPTLICGGAGCGKTLFGVEFLVKGALDHGEPGILVSFEETEAEIAQNVASLGFDLPGLVAGGKLGVEHVRVERSEIEETGEYNLDGLFIRLGAAIDAIGARRVVLDTIESLFSGLGDHAILRAELRRLFRWLKDRGVTTVITGERGEGQLTRQGLEEYVSDCVILLDHRVIEQQSTRRLRVVESTVARPTARTSSPSSSTRRGSPSSPSPPSRSSTRPRPSASLRASPASTPCSAGRGTTGGAASS